MAQRRGTELPELLLAMGYDEPRTDDWRDALDAIESLTIIVNATPAIPDHEKESFFAILAMLEQRLVPVGWENCRCHKYPDPDFHLHSNDTEGGCTAEDCYCEANLV